MIGKFSGGDIPPEFSSPKREPGGNVFPPKFPRPIDGPRFPPEVDGPPLRDGPDGRDVSKRLPDFPEALKDKLGEAETTAPLPEESLARPQCADARHCPVENGKWVEGERGDGKWVPEGEHVPGKANPENQTWDEILEEHDIDGVTFKDGEPDFKQISKGDVEIEEFSTSRSDNFDKADTALAEQRGCKPEDVERWRKENGYTWHEKGDMKTLQKVPSKVHNNIPHQGGIAAAKNTGAAA